MVFGNVFGSSGGHVNVTLDRIKRSISAAGGNSNKAPWGPAPTWTISTTYGFGQIVRGTGVDAKHLYIMAGSATTVAQEGTTSGTGTGPSGSTVSLITDGTCRWVFYGYSTSTGATPLISTSTLTNASSVMNGFISLVSATTLGNIGLVGYTPSAVTGSFSTEAYFSGGLFNARNQDRLNGHNSGSFAVPVYNSSSERGSFKLYTNSSKWIAIRAESPIVYRNQNVAIRVNGIDISEGTFVLGVDSNFGDNAFLVNMSLFPPGAKLIEVVVADTIKNRIAFELYQEPGSYIWPAKPRNQFTLAVEGDSIAGGSYYSGDLPMLWLEKLVADHLGCNNWFSNAEGGTGVINDASTTKTTYLGRLQDIVDFAPDLLFINGFHNDMGEADLYTSAARRAAILTYLQAVRSQLPKCYIVMVGTQLLANESTDTGPNTQHQVELDAKWAFDQFNDSNSLFIPLLTDVKPRIINTNFVHYLVTTAPYNDGHPIPQYYNYYAPMIADKIAEWLMGKH